MTVMHPITHDDEEEEDDDSEDDDNDNNDDGGIEKIGTQELTIAAGRKATITVNPRPQMWRGCCRTSCAISTPITTTMQRVKAPSVESRQDRPSVLSPILPCSTHYDEVPRVEDGIDMLMICPWTTYDMQHKMAPMRLPQRLPCHDCGQGKTTWKRYLTTKRTVSEVKRLGKNKGSQPSFDSPLRRENVPFPS